MDQADDNSLTALLTKRDPVRFREIVNTCTERRAEKRIQRTACILSHVLRKTLCEHVNGLCPAGWLNEQSSTGSSPYVRVHIGGPSAATRPCGSLANRAEFYKCVLPISYGSLLSHFMYCSSCSLALLSHTPSFSVCEIYRKKYFFPENKYRDASDPR